MSWRSARAWSRVCSTRARLSASSSAERWAATAASSAARSSPTVPRRQAIETRSPPETVSTPPLTAQKR